MKSAGIIIACWLGASLTLAALFAIFAAWRDRQARLRSFLAEDRLMALADPLEDLWCLPSREPRSTA